jgi:hypothetical protein
MLHDETLSGAGGALVSSVKAVEASGTSSEPGQINKRSDLFVGIKVAFFQRDLRRVDQGAIHTTSTAFPF